MADLNAIYAESGIPGIIPYAIRDRSGGRQMLLKKMNEGVPLYTLFSVINTPFLVVKDGRYQMCVFSSEELAGEKRKELAASRFDTAVKEIPANIEKRKDFLLSACNSGASAVFLNDSLSLPISAFVKTPTYDSHPNSEHMLRNQALNGALSYYMQIAYGQMSNYDAENRWTQAMAGGKFLLMVKDNSKEGYPFITTKKGEKTCLLAYTDWEQASAGLESMKYDGSPCAFTATFFEMMDIVKEHPEIAILLNSETCHLIMDKVLMEQIHQGAVTPAAVRGMTPVTGGSPLVQVDEKDWDIADPTPDWLR